MPQPGTADHRLVRQLLVVLDRVVVKDDYLSTLAYLPARLAGVVPGRTGSYVTNAYLPPIHNICLLLGGEQRMGLVQVSVVELTGSEAVELVGHRRRCY